MYRENMRIHINFTHYYKTRTRNEQFLITRLGSKWSIHIIVEKLTENLLEILVLVWYFLYYFTIRRNW